MSLFIHWNMKFNIISLANQLILCSEWVPSEWEFKQLIKTSAWSTSKQYLVCAYFTPNSDEATFSLVLEKAILWTEDSYFNWKQWIEVKTITSWMFITNMQIFPWQDVKWWTKVHTFISCVNSCSDGTHSLQRINWWSFWVNYSFNKTVMEELFTIRSEMSIKKCVQFMPTLM